MCGQLVIDENEAARRLGIRRSLAYDRLDED
jgi:hypothetical protein